MPDEAKSENEIAAKLALIANALSPSDLEGISDEEILECLNSSPELTEEAKRSLADLGNNPFRSRRQTAQGKTEENQPSAAPLQYAGMYRLGCDEDLDPRVQEEIERKRREILKKIRDQKKDV